MKFSQVHILRLIKKIEENPGGSSNLVWTGVYSDLTTYSTDNLVEYNGSTYICISESTGNTPTNPIYWALLASKGEQGVKGDKGDQGDPGLPGTAGLDGDDGISFIWKGTYVPETSYVINDVVAYEGSSYICILASTGNLPTNSTYWAIMAQKGDTGSGGAVVTTVQFDNDDLVSGKYTITGLVNILEVRNNSSQKVNPDIYRSGGNTIVNIDNFGVITGTWEVDYI